MEIVQSLLTKMGIFRKPQMKIDDTVCHHSDCLWQGKQYSTRVATANEQRELIADSLKNSLISLSSTRK